MMEVALRDHFSTLLLTSLLKAVIVSGDGIYVAIGVFPIGSSVPHQAAKTANSSLLLIYLLF